MPDKPSNLPRRSRWSCCLFSALGLLVIAILVVILGWLSREWVRESALAESKDRWERQVADVKAGKRTRISWPEPRFLEDFVKNQPEVAAKITEVGMLTGKASDERFRYVRQFRNLESIDLYEIWEGADTFLKNIAGMESLTSLSLCKTRLSEEGIRAVASFPNLKRLHIDWAWKGADLKPLRGQRSIERLELDEVPIPTEWIAVIATLPKLKEVVVDDEEATHAQLLELQKVVPKLKVTHTP
jgi:hypothetical protein